MINHQMKTNTASLTYLVDNEVMNTPKSMKNEPNIIVGLNKPKSVALPEKVPMKKSKKI